METMPTTIRIRKDTLRLLKMLKEQENMKSYDELISTLIRRSKNIGESQMGKYPALAMFDREECWKPG